ncbi:hypothetical protein A8709_10035 [Paenibacillus pectinilyticus]|uniref:Diguanylate cyclase n=1 Tax=Paenibacillus pectinilyticus TaxID=512399 RepID=A0A1C1A5V7_9BACL|nr:sensor domain-containing diguanylate cyclase [Paenibacillus pectinilyticus]OCT15950.1 hypothetical protein A8709_10035 [Paenibacillus pectinilyticus]
MSQRAEFNPPVIQDSFARQIMEQAWDLYCKFDVHGKLTYASSRCLDLIGYMPEEFQQIVGLIDSEYRIDLHKLFIQILQGSSSSKLEFRARATSGAHLWLECTAFPICDTQGELLEIIFALNDITLRKNQESRLVAMAFRDPLTSLPNRRLFKEHLLQQLQQAKRTNRAFALLYVDIDDFKIINDTMGHDVGDAFLQEFAKRIQGCLREVDTFARMGGDEFTILLPGVDCSEHVESVAQRIIQCVEQPWEVQGHTFTTTISMGITMYRSDQTDAVQMMKEVDIALYQVKGKGRNHYQFYDKACANSPADC